MAKCRWPECDEPVNTEPDKSKPSCLYWDRSDDSETSKVAMYTSKVCKHGYCSHHAGRLEHQRKKVGRES